MLWAFLLSLLCWSTAWAEEAWCGTITVESTFAGVDAGASRAGELDGYAKALEQRLATLRERRRTADGVVERVLARDIGQLEGELEAIALDRGAWVSLGRDRYALDGTMLAMDAELGSLLIDRQAGTGRLIRGNERNVVKIAPLVEAVEPPGAVNGPAFQGHATRTVTVDVAGSPARLVWAPGLPNIYALSRIDSQVRSKLHSVLAALPGLPVEVESQHKGGRLRWRVVELRPGPVEASVFSR